MKLVMIGFMGAGKSSVGRELASLSLMAFSETDDVALSRSGGETIEEIFAVQGEQAFRRLESAALVELLSGPHPCIISTGGGIVENESNRELLRESGATVVLLDASFREVRRRVGEDSARPLFRDVAAAELRYEARRNLYRDLADLVFWTEHRAPRELAETILSFVASRPCSRSLFTVIGDPVGHSLSPALHEAALAAAGLQDRIFSAQRVSDLPAFLDHFRSHPEMSGLAVTIPFKEQIVPLLDELTEEARTLGAVNTVIKRDGRLVGANTDWIGVREPLALHGEVSGKQVLVIGAGGTARAALYAVQQLGGSATVANRTVSRGEQLARDFSVPFRPLTEVDSLEGFDIVLNTTSYGLKGQEESLFSPRAFRPGMIVMDVIYTPPITALLRAAAEAGAETIPGSEMFLAQAKAQYRIHQGREPELQIMKATLESLLC